MKLLKVHVFKRENSSITRDYVPTIKEIKAFDVEHAWEIFTNHMHQKSIESWVYVGLKEELEKEKKSVTNVPTKIS